MIENVIGRAELYPLTAALQRRVEKNPLAVSIQFLIHNPNPNRG